MWSSRAPWSTSSSVLGDAFPSWPLQRQMWRGLCLRTGSRVLSGYPALQQMRIVVWVGPCLVLQSGWEAGAAFGEATRTQARGRPGGEAASQEGLALRLGRECQGVGRVLLQLTQGQLELQDWCVRQEGVWPRRPLALDC